MLRKSKGRVALSERDKELVALGAAIASNCVPCVEYHIPRVRKIGLSDSEMRAAVELANGVRRVPAAKVLQTALALLETETPTRAKPAQGPCGCPDRTRNPGHDTAAGAGEPHATNVRLDHAVSQEDNKRKSECCGDDGKDS